MIVYESLFMIFFVIFYLFKSKVDKLGFLFLIKFKLILQNDFLEIVSKINFDNKNLLFSYIFFGNTL